MTDNIASRHRRTEMRRHLKPRRHLVQSGAALTLMVLGAVAAAAIARAGTRARMLFITNCAQCHMANGNGTPGLAPPLRERVARFAQEPGGWRYLAQVISFGLSGQIEAQGARYDGYMPSFAALAVADRAAILNYAATLTARGLSLRPITATEVERLTRQSVAPAVLLKERSTLRGSSTMSGQPHGGPLLNVHPSPHGEAPPSTSVEVWSGSQLAYARCCSGCHQLSGDGIPGHVPPLKGVVGYFVRSPAGRTYVARLPDIAYSPLSDKELAALLNWAVRRFSASPPLAHFTPYTPTEVAALRRRPLKDVGPVRAQVLRHLAVSNLRIHAAS